MWAIKQMAYSDRFIIQTVRTLQGRDVTVHEIAAHAGIPYGTAKHALSRLQKSGIIRRKGHGRRWGCKYEIVEVSGEPTNTAG